MYPNQIIKSKPVNPYFDLRDTLKAYSRKENTTAFTGLIYNNKRTLIK
jgi:hypothetical protein